MILLSDWVRLPPLVNELLLLLLLLLASREVKPLKGEWLAGFEEHSTSIVVALAGAHGTLLLPHCLPLNNDSSRRRRR